MLFKLLLWPLRGRLRRRATLLLVVAGVGWWRFHDWNRPPEGTVDVYLEQLGPDDQPLAFEEPPFAPEFFALEPAARQDYAREYRAFWEGQVEAAFQGARERGNYIEVPRGLGGATALPPEVPLDALTRTIIDPSQARYDPPVAWVLVLTPEAEPELFEQREHLNWLLAQFEPGELDALASTEEGAPSK
jgi:hypothetical protein